MPMRSSLFKLMGGLRTLKGGVQLMHTVGPKRFHAYEGLPSLTSGTDTTPVAGTRWTSSVFIPHNAILTGIGYLIGSVGGTDNVRVELHDADGTLLASSAVAGATVGTAATIQEVPFTAPVEVVGPGWYYLSVTMNGTTARLRTQAAATSSAHINFTKSATGTFGTSAALTPPTAFAAGTGPIAHTY